MGILAAKASFNYRWITLDREVSKTVIGQQVARYNSSIKGDITLKLAIKKFYMRLTFEIHFKIEFNTTVYQW